MRATDRTWIAVTVAGVLGSLTLRSLTEDTGYLAAGWFLIALSAVIAVVGARVRLPKVLVTLLQLLVAGVVLVAYAVGPGDPEVGWWARIGPLVAQGIDHMRVSAAPMGPEPGVRIILAAVVAGMALLAGILADALERPALSLAPLLTLYAIPAIALRADVGFSNFVLIATGYLCILFADGLNAEKMFTRNITSDQASGGAFRGTGGVWRVGALVAVPALVLSIVVGLVLPTLTTTFFESLRPSGAGPIEMADPQLDLRRNLQQPENRPVLSYTTNKDSGTYLRLTSLPLIGPDGWGQSRVALKQGALGPVPGIAAAPSPQNRVTDVQIGDFRSMYLPVPYAPRAQNARGEWSHDPASLMVIATGQNRQAATENLAYTVQSWDIEPDGAVLSTARAGTPQEAVTAEVPGDIPQPIVQLTTSLTQNSPTPALKAAAIQAYLRSFTYSVQGASGATNYKAIETFLLQTKTGYCVQFAGSMALMARIAGIPSRVAIGFLPGARQADRWVVTTHDMHAWPELYFEGFGWVRFEPTPSVAAPPPWSVLAPNQPVPTQSAVPEPSVETSAAPTASATAIDTTAGTDTGASPWQLVADIARGLAVGLVVAALALAPWLYRRRLRARRLAADGPDEHVRVDGAWAELRDTWLDLGRVWPEGSARQIAGQVAAVVGEGAPRESLRRLVVAVERSRYAADLGALTSLSDDATRVVAALEASVGWDGRLLARFRPSSLWVTFRQWAVTAWSSRPTRAASPAPEPAAAGAATDHARYRRP